MDERSDNPLERANEEIRKLKAKYEKESKRREEVEQEMLFLEAENQKLRAENQKLRAEIQELVTKYEKENEIAQNFLIESHLKDAEISELEAKYTKSQQVAAAIRDLQLMMDPEDPTKPLFTNKYQWQSIYDVMCKYYLLPENDPDIFCEICDNVEHPRYFLSADHYDIGYRTNYTHYCSGLPKVNGKRQGKSTYNEITKHTDNERKRQTDKVFEELLRLHEAIDEIK